MQINVNKDIDQYKDDFFKGMTLKQTAVCALTLAVGVGSFFFFYAVLHIPQTVSLYLIFPLALPVALFGFLKPDGTSLTTYLKRRHEVMTMPVYRFEPLAFKLLNEERKEEAEIQGTKEHGKRKRPEEPLPGTCEEDF